MKLNSVIFHTTRLDVIRHFYEEVLAFSIGTYEHNAEEVNDCSDTYVNYNVGGTLLCFESDEKRTDVATVVLHVRDLQSYRKELEQKGLEIKGQNESFFKIKDPEGRALIFEPL